MAEPSVEELMNDYLRMRKIEDLFHSPQQVQEVKPINPLYDNKSPFFDYINNPIKTEDPMKNLLAGVIGTDERMGLGDFIPGLSQTLARRRKDKLGEYLGYLDFIPGGGIAGEAISLLAKRQKAIRKLKREQEIQLNTTDPTELAGSAKEVKRLEKVIKKIDAEEAAQKAKFRIDDDYVPDEMFKTPYNPITDFLEGNSSALGDFYKYKTPPEGALFRGDRSGFLKRGKGFDITDSSDIVPSSGIYSVIDPTDPRFKIFAQGMPSRGGTGSGYVINPNFENILDIDNIPPNFLKKLENLQKGLGDFQLDTILRGGPGSINKTPSGFSQEMSDIFRKEGYDALRFPPRKMKGELDTVISLDPKNLNIVDEIPFDDLDDFIRQFLSEQ
jgi:hypothetical protein